MNKPKSLQPFIKMCATIGELPTSYLVSMTYEEQLLWLCNYLEKTVIPTINNNGLAVEELQAKYIELKSYIDDSFENLDVQDEIDNKLDEMAESGELENIISQYLQLATTYAYSTVNEMENATNLVNGCYAKTYGFYSINDGGGAYYKVRTILNTDVIDNITLFAITSDDTLVAELLIQNEMSIKQFGAKGDGSNDDTASIQACLDNCRKVYIPSTNNYYKVIESLDIDSNQIIYGDGESSKILMPNNLEEKIFYIHNKENINIQKIKLCNESCQTGSTPDLTKNLLIYIDGCENINIKECFFEYAYSRGIEVFKTKNFNYINNIFKNATFNMLLLLPECENAIVDNCIFDTITSTYINTYLFATGRNDTETYEFSCKNVTVKNSKFLNNANWEGIDTHACNGFYCYDNYISNCKIGIIAHYGSTAPITSDTVKHGDIYIKDNIIVNPATSNTYGMSVGVALDQGFLCKNVVIENNYIDGYGISDNLASINVIGIKYLTLKNNNIINSHGSGINFTGIINANVIGNNVLETNSNYGFQYVAGCWFLNVRDNTIKNLTATNLLYGVRTSLLNISQFENNDVVATNRYQSNGTLMSGAISSGTNQIGKKGNFVKNEYGIITHYCTDTVIHPAKTEILSSVSLTGVVDTNVVTGTNALYYLTEGEEITLQGAGLGGVDLTTIITEFIGRDSFKVKDTILTSFTNQNPKTTAGTWVVV